MSKWTDEQCLKFASIAFRHAPKNLPDGVTLDDIRIAASTILSTASEQAPVAWAIFDVHGECTNLSFVNKSSSEWAPLYLSTAHTSEARDAVVGEVVEIGDDDEGQPRILIHTTREAIKNGPPLAFRTVSVAAMRQEAGRRD